MKKIFAFAVGVCAIASAFAAESVPTGVANRHVEKSAHQSAVKVPTQKAEVLRLAEKVADYQIATMAGGVIPEKASWDTPHKDGWVQGTLFIGLTELADRSEAPRFKQVIFARGEANKWAMQPGPFADHHAIGQTYLWAAANGAGNAALTPMRENFDAILKNPPKVDLKYFEENERFANSMGCLERWCWCDALFMAPATWLGLSKATGDKRYAEFAKSEFNATTDYLYDKSESLYFRDSRFFDRRNKDGKKVFWSRGNGWVFAGLTRSIPLLPENDPVRARMVEIFKQMAVKLKTIQKPDGYWSPSLLEFNNKTLPETSGTAFYVHGLAWGVKNGLLSKAEYEPAIRSGWGALVKALHPSGKLGWVQPVSDRPEEGSFDDTQFYGVGGFLMAATSVADLNLDATASAKSTSKK
jgi:rhamnogalacturonyl hydrolase YesR